MGRFLSTDTVQPNAPSTQGYNLYAYTANNPTTWTDLSGHMSTEMAELLGLVGAEGLLALLVSPELVGIVAVGVFVAVVIWAVVAILSCVLDAACMDRLQQQGHAIKQYGSAAAAGAWTLGGAATRTAWHNFPGTPKGALCALGAAESMVASAVTNGITGQKTSASDYWYAAGMGCATGGSGGNGGGSSSKLPGGLRNASAGLRQLYVDGSVRGKSVIEIRSILVNNGFTQTITDNGQGYLFTNGTGEEVRVMSKGGSWEIRVRNSGGNYLDEFGNAAQGRAASHGFMLYSK